jgi:predicted component of type VI protein secretion system
MLEQRVARLEDKVDRIEAAIVRIEPRISEIVGEVRQLPKANDIASLKADIAEVRGRLSMLPTWWMLVVALIATWSAGAGIVFTLVKASHP